MKKTSTIHISQLQLIAQYATTKQVPLSNIFNGTDVRLIESSCNVQQHAYISTEQFKRLLKQLSHYFNEPAMVLELSALIRTAHLGVLGYLLHACDNLAEALLRLYRYSKLIINDSSQISIHQANHELELQWHHTEPIEPIIAEFGMAIIWQFSQQLTSQRLALKHIKFSHDAEADMKTYQQFFDCAVSFNQPLNSFCFSASHLNIEIAQPDKTLLDILQRQAEQALQQLPATSDFLKKAQLQLMALCQHGEPKLAHLAQHLYISPRTLQRRLLQQDLSFQKLLDEGRQELGKRYLIQNLSLDDIAQLLGYSDQSAFTRAFKRWTGTTPLQYQLRVNK